MHEKLRQVTRASFLIRIRHASAAALVLIRHAQHRVFLETHATLLAICLPEQSFFNFTDDSIFIIQSCLRRAIT